LYDPVGPLDVQNGFVPIEPPPTVWRLPNPNDAGDTVGDLVGVGGDLEPGTILAGYRSGLFPMPLPEELHDKSSTATPVAWWSPDTRAILELSNLRVTRSLRRSMQRYEVRVDTAFLQTIEGCADPSRSEGFWISDDIIAAYLRLHELGWAHSVEAWDTEDGTLAGGLYGVGISGFFAGESMFHRKTDASKVALVGLVELLRERNYQLLDVQWQTSHLQSLGVTEISRPDYLLRLDSAVEAVAEPLGPLP
jgi:leucyl/phenylalanyl-tRNA--protein transferase